MKSCIDMLSREAGWRLQSILRPRRFFSTKQLINLYKCQVLSYIEAGVPGYYHAASSIIYSLDRMQIRLLRELAISETDALHKFNLAPLNTRRNIAMLGLFNRIYLGSAPSQLIKLFPFQVNTSRRYFTRLDSRRHPFQFVEPRFYTDIYRRSLFGLTVIYNLLPRTVVNAITISRFLQLLQKDVKTSALQQLPNWKFLFSSEIRTCNTMRIFELLQ